MATSTYSATILHPQRRAFREDGTFDRHRGQVIWGRGDAVVAGATAAAVCDIHVWLLLHVVRSRHRRRCVKMAEMHGKDLKRRDANMWSSHSTTFAMAATTASVPVASVLVSSATNHASLHARRRWRRWKHTAVTPTTPQWRSRGGESEAGDAGACDHTRAVALSRRCAGTYVPLHLQPLAALAALRCLTSAAAARTPTPAA